MHDHRTRRRIGHTNLQQVPCTIGADEHHEAILEVFDSDREVERVENLRIVKPVSSGTCGDRWHSTPSKLACDDLDEALSPVHWVHETGWLCMRSQCCW